MGRVMDFQEDKDEFSFWLGKEIQGLLHIHDASLRFDEGKNLIDRFISMYSQASANERRTALDSLQRLQNLGEIGDLKINSVNRDEYDSIEAILATIEAYLQDE